MEPVGPENKYGRDTRELPENWEAGNAAQKHNLFRQCLGNVLTIFSQLSARQRNPKLDVQGEADWRVKANKAMYHHISRLSRVDEHIQQQQLREPAKEDASTELLRELFNTLRDYEFDRPEDRPLKDVLAHAKRHLGY